MNENMKNYLNTQKDKPQVEVVRAERSIQGRTDEFIQATPNVTTNVDGVVNVANNSVIIPEAVAVITDFKNGKNGQTIKVYAPIGLSVVGPNIVRTSPNPVTKQCILTFTYIEYVATTLAKSTTLLAKWVENYA